MTERMYLFFTEVRSGRHRDALSARHFGSNLKRKGRAILVVTLAADCNLYDVPGMCLTFGPGTLLYMYVRTMCCL